MVKAPEAWAMIRQKHGGDAWQTIRVGHIDTGYTEHPALGFSGGSSPFDHIHEGVNYLEGGLPFDPLDYPGTPGHGTRTSSVLSGPHARQFLGVAPGVAGLPHRTT